MPRCTLKGPKIASWRSFLCLRHTILATSIRPNSSCPRAASPCPSTLSFGRGHDKFRRAVGDQKTFWLRLFKRGLPSLTDGKSAKFTKIFLRRNPDKNNSIQEIPQNQEFLPGLTRGESPQTRVQLRRSSSQSWPPPSNPSVMCDTEGGSEQKRTLEGNRVLASSKALDGIAHSPGERNVFQAGLIRLTALRHCPREGETGNAGKQPSRRRALSCQCS